MLFSSATFLFLFLPIVCGLYFMVRRDLRNYVLLAASMLFYAWGEPRYLAIMLLTIVINWGGALLISRASRGRRAILAGTIAVDLGMLIYFKYFNFIIGGITGIAGMSIGLLDVIMPIGISFYTFQALSYVVDVYRRDVPAQRDMYNVALYICLFPQLIAGPIVKYHDVAAQIENRTETPEKIVYGVQRFIIGLAKKMLIANTMGAVADKVFALGVADFGPGIAWIGIIAYALQLFYDFSGYSDMAIGLGSIFGFRFLENFNYPYISKSISEFWRRWHISLSTWFKEYLYIPLGGNRVSKRRNYFNLFMVFVATGVWHGAAWSFVIWGIWNGIFILVEKATGWNKRTGGIALRFVQHIYTMFVVLIGLVIFRSDNISRALKYIRIMFGLKYTPEVYSLQYYMGTLEWIMMAIGILCAMPVFSKMLEWSTGRASRAVLVNAWLLTLFVVSASFIAASTYNPFIYFRF